MFFLYGSYRWGPRTTAFRNDFCVTCGGPRRALQVRTFDVIHVFWVPVLPLGFWRRWFCAVCHMPPDAHRRILGGLKALGLATLLLFTFVFWALPSRPLQDVAFWLFRIAAPIGAVVTAAHLLRSRRDHSHGERASSVLPANDQVCPFCQIPLVTPGWRCPHCGIERR